MYSNKVQQFHPDGSTNQGGSQQQEEACTQKTSKDILRKTCFYLKKVVMTGSREALDNEEAVDQSQRELKTLVGLIMRGTRPHLVSQLKNK